MSTGIIPFLITSRQKLPYEQWEKYFNSPLQGPELRVNYRHVGYRENVINKKRVDSLAGLSFDLIYWLFTYLLHGAESFLRS
jgi:hypothetical protein